MLSVDEYLARLLSLVEPLDPFPLGLLDARGCRLAEDVRPNSDAFSRAHSTVDGYAVLMADVIGAEFHEVGLDVLPAFGEAGEPTPLVRGSAVRLFVGDPVPHGTEAVIPVEHTDGDLQRVLVRKSATPGQFIRQPLFGQSKSPVLAEVGSHIDARLVGLLAAAGRNSVLAQPRPRLVVITVGDDVADSGVDANGYLLAAAAAEIGATVFRVGPVSEAAESILRTLEDQLVRADLMLLTASSASGYDHVQAALEQLGDSEIVRVAMQPGVGQAYGVIGGDRVPVIVLPGGAVATYIAFEVLVRPVLRKLQALPADVVTAESAVVDVPLQVEANRRNYIPARSSLDETGRRHVAPVDAFALDPLSGLVSADCFIVVPEAVIEVQAGDAVDVLPIGLAG